MSKNHERTKKNDAPEALIPSSANILVTGGAGFIGSNFIRHVLGRADFTGTVVNYDTLTYAGNLDTLAPLAGNPRHVFVQGDIGDRDLVGRLLGALAGLRDPDRRLHPRRT